jgi:outer membrane protein OmpA-like peptidoglycan-associated protein
MRKLPILLTLLPLFLVTGCTRLFQQKVQPQPIIRQPIVENVFTHLQMELKPIAAANCNGSKELVVRFPEVALFDVSAYCLSPKAQEVLSNVAKILNKYPKFIIIVEGHTDSRGEESYNQWLSEQRSRFAAGLLVRQGVDPYRIQVVGYGESRPLVSEDSAADRRRNRRVELHIIPVPVQPRITKASPIDER